MAFWFIAWNKIKKGSYTVPQISMSSLGSIANSFNQNADRHTTPICAVNLTVTTLIAWASKFGVGGSAKLFVNAIL
jgi:hypothetical protein